MTFSRIRGQQAADHPEAVRVQARRRLHQHHFGAGAPLRFDDEQDGDFFILVHNRVQKFTHC